MGRIVTQWGESKYTEPKHSVLDTVSFFEGGMYSRKSSIADGWEQCLGGDQVGNRATAVVRTCPVWAQEYRSSDEWDDRVWERTERVVRRLSPETAASGLTGVLTEVQPF